MTRSNANGQRYTNSGQPNLSAESDLRSLPSILLLGQTGAGKSSFIGTADLRLEPKPEVGHGLHACTKDIQPYKVQNTANGPEGRSVILVDTPGFNDSNSPVEGESPQKKIEKWLNDRPGLNLEGMIILHDISTARVADNEFLNLLPKMENRPNIAFVTTQWPASQSDAKFEDCEKREVELSRILTQEVPKIEVKRSDNSAKLAWSIINDVSPPPAIMLLGQTGCGKSSFINKADPNLNCKAEVTHGLASCTKNPKEFRVENPNNPGSSVILVDTPELNDWDSDLLHGDKKHLVTIIDWLKIKPNMKFAGIFYLYDITETRNRSPYHVMVNTATRKQKDSRSLQAAFLTTKWLANDLTACECREADLRRDLPRVTMHRFDGSTESAWKIIEGIRTTTDLLSAQELRIRLENLHDNFFPEPGENIFVKFFMELMEWLNRPKSKQSF